MKKPTDLRFVSHGTFVLMHPLTTKGRKWASAKIRDDAMRLGDAVAIEHRFAEDIIEGAQRDGMRVELSK